MEDQEHLGRTVSPNEQDISNRDLGRTVRIAAGAGILAVGGAAAAIVAVTGEFTSTHSLLGEVGERAFFMTPGLMTAYIGQKMIRK
jgi:hypothetical protein